MVRWEPGARERLQAAALELFATRGYEQTTAAEIAQSVGLTERTFFRHFSDKREVLFYGGEQFLQGFVDGVDAAPPGASPFEVIAFAQWLREDETRSLAEIESGVLRELLNLTGAAAVAPPSG